MKKTQLNLLMAVASLCLVGCISHKTTIHRDVDRAKVEFENETAAKLFYEKLSHMPSFEKKETRTDLSIPLVFEYERKIETNDNRKFNEAVHRCDTNQNGKITELEAKIFSAQP